MERKIKIWLILVFFLGVLVGGFLAANLQPEVLCLEDQVAKASRCIPV